MKYLGSKSRIAKHIVPIIQKCIDDNKITKYYEPFVGGANVIDKIKCINRYGSDKNKYLIALLRYVQQERELLDDVPRQLYNEVREAYNNNLNIYEDWYIGMVGFLASYNGRWFDGGYAQPGYENTKNGKRYRNYYQEAKNNIIQQIPNIRNVEFAVADYRDYNFNDIEASVIYCDPPYANTKGYETSKNFNCDEFWNTVRKWSVSHYVLVSEEDAPDDFVCIWEKSVPRSIKATDKSKSIEKLFTYNKGLYYDKYKNKININDKLF